MRLSKVNNWNTLTFYCQLCKQEIKDDVYADLDGPSFESYYHKECGYNFYAIQAVEEPEKRNMDLLCKLITELHPGWNGWQAAKVDIDKRGLHITTLHCDDGDLSVYRFEDEAEFWNEVDDAIKTAREEDLDFIPTYPRRHEYREVIYEMLYAHQDSKQTLWG